MGSGKGKAKRARAGSSVPMKASIPSSPQPLVNTRLRDEDNRAQFAFGDCLHFAAAVHQLHPELRLAVLFYGDPNDEFTERHVICYDDVFSYDSHGSLPLEEATAGAHTELDLEPEDAASILGDYLNPDLIKEALQLLAAV